MAIHERAVSALLLDAIRRFHVERRSGTVVVAHGGGERRLRFRAGDLFLDADDPLAPSCGAGAGADACVAALLDALAGWTPTGVQEDEPPAGDAPLIGPLPTAQLLMEAATHGRSEEDLLAELGGPQAKIVGRDLVSATRRVPSLAPEDAFLLSRLERPMALHDLLQQGMMERGAVLQRVARLRAIDLVAPAGEPVVAIEEPLLTPVLLQRFLDRIGSDLEAEPLQLATAHHRARVASLLAGCGAMTAYELLGIPLDATPDAAHLAYQDLARLVHPSHAASLQLPGGDGVLRVLFELATEAYLTLSDDKRRASYDLRMGIGERQVGGEARREERRRVAERNFQLASGFAAEEEFHYAIELLRQAVSFDPQPRYYLLLARCLGRNAKWLDQAIESCRQGLRLAPQDAALRLQLGQLQERSASPVAAAAEYARVLELEPKRAEALEGLERLASELGISRDALLKRARAERSAG